MRPVAESESPARATPPTAARSGPAFPRPRWALVSLLAALLAASLGQWSCGEPPVVVEDGGTGGGEGTGGSATGGGEGTGGSATGGGTGTDAGFTPGYSRDLSIIVEPSDNAAALRTAITNARSSVHVTMYLLSNTSIINALIAQKNAGRDVKVLLNQNFFGGAGTNTSSFNTLKNAGVNVKWAPATVNLTHQKTVIVDGTTAWIMTMNITNSSPSSNREFLAVNTTPEDVRQAEDIFTADFTGGTPTVPGNLLVSPGDARARMVAELNSATATIDMEAEELSDYQIVGALVAAQARGARVRVVLSDNTRTNAQANALLDLKSAGVSVVSLKTPYLHAKSFVVDGKSAYVGSQNFTTNSLVYNRELGVLFTVPSEVKKVLTTTTQDFSKGTAL